MRCFAISLLCGASFLGAAQTTSIVETSPDQITFSALQMTDEGNLLKLRGQAQISSSSVTIAADEADYNLATNSLDVRGHAHINFKDETSKLNIRNSSPSDLPVMR